jgi:HSP90 family molecular chaperone
LTSVSLATFVLVVTDSVAGLMMKVVWESYARLLYDQAVIAEGSRIKDPAGFAQRINKLLVQNMQNRSKSSDVG